MAESGIKLQLKGFDDLIEQIQKAGGSIDRAAESSIKQSAQIMQAELKSKMVESNVSGDLIGRMPPPTFEHEGNKFTARVGYPKENFDPKNVSDGYKVIFINYGTPKRSKHGKITARGFIQNAKKSAKPKIKKSQKETLEKILGRVKSK